MSDIQQIIMNDASIRAEVMADSSLIGALQDIGKNPENLAKYSSNPKVLSVMKKVEAAREKSGASSGGPPAPAASKPKAAEVVPSRGKLQVHMCPLGGKTFTANADYNTSVADLKEQVLEKDKVAADKVCLCYAKNMEVTPMDDSKSLRDYPIQSGDTIFARRPQHATWSGYAYAFKCAPPPFMRTHQNAPVLGM
eukprot:CAMPEP_0179226912 /NCGR_PEP_ID=MMETSP0797-20121207/9053_1 /TAXON_ID=47934 /ORGANISM="Dinophysis acuminata, Strain DAEP01" /LENGTH=194 /DNA_ID=CAMNT_0020933945 /DNA_START=100 /DNA_END=684 /DNA_ORIENTATION=+